MPPPATPTPLSVRPTGITTAVVIANTTNVVVVLCALFAVGSVLFAPAEVNGHLLRSSFLLAVGVSLLSIVAHALVWFLEQRHPEGPHAVQHWASAHVASIAGFLGANWMWLHP